MTPFIVGTSSDQIYMALHKAGVFQNDPDTVRRVIIDLECGNAAKIYVETFADKALTDVLLRGGIEIVERNEDAEKPA